MTETYCFGEKKKNQVSEQYVPQNPIFIKINLHTCTHMSTYMSVYAQKKVWKDAHQTNWVTSKEVVWGGISFMLLCCLNFYRHKTCSGYED